MAVARKLKNTVEWSGRFPRLLNDPEQDAREAGIEAAEKLLRELDKELAKKPRKLRKKRK